MDAVKVDTSTKNYFIESTFFKRDIYLISNTYLTLVLLNLFVRVTCFIKISKHITYSKIVVAAYRSDMFHILQTYCSNKSEKC